MDSDERKRILGQWGVRGETSIERAQRELLERELEGQPYRGRRVAPRPQFLHRSPESYVASRGGPLPYMVRLREIEAETRNAERALADRWHDLAFIHRGDPAAFASAWRRLADAWDFAAVNDLIDRHNRFYPAEARLPMDVRRRDYALVNGEHYAKARLDADWVIARFPASLDAASAAA